MLKLIGLHGAQGSGKDTAAAALDDYARVAFADPVKRCLIALNPYLGSVSMPLSEYLAQQHTDPMIALDRVKRSTPEIRHLMQRLGTDAVRTYIGDTTWIDLAYESVTDLQKAGRHVVATDVRFDNEAAGVRDWGGKIIHIIRPDQRHTDNHASERTIDPALIDYTVINDGTVHQLQEQIRAIVRHG